MDYKTLQTRHPEYDHDYWDKIKHLYEGEYSLRKCFKHNTKLRDAVFPKHLGETDDVYEERLKRFFYVNYFQSIVKGVVTTLGSDPINVNAGYSTVDTDEEVKVDPFYQDFAKNVARPGAERMTFNRFMLDRCIEALLYKRTWVLVDFPTPGDEAEKPMNRLEEEQMGLDHAYLVACCPELVYDWEEDDAGNLLWALVYGKSEKRESIEDSRDMVTETYTIYDREGWTRYTYSFKESDPPNENKAPDKTEQGKHSFGQVPLVRFCLPHDMWAGSMLSGVAVEILNKYAALSWSNYRTLFQMQIAYLDSPDADPLNPILEDTERAVRQIEGPGRVKVMAKGDRIEMLAPEASPFAEARAYIKEMKEEMYRILHQMSQSVENSAATMKRSAESKGMDQSSTIIVAKELGSLVRTFAEDIYNMVSAGRKDEVEEWTASGFSEFEELQAKAAVDEAATLETVNIPSATFHRGYKMHLIRTLWPEATDEDLKQCKEELEDAITDESVQPLGAMPMGGVDPNDPNADPAGASADPFSKGAGPEKAPAPVKGQKLAAKPSTNN